MNMMDMIEEAQELCEKARVCVATEDCMDAAYKLCDLQVLLVRMEYEAKRDDTIITQVDGTVYKIPAEPGRAPEIGYVYSGQTTAVGKENLNSVPVVCPSPAEMMHEGGYVEPRQATVSEPRFDNQPNPTPTVTTDPAQTHIDAPQEWIREEITEAPELNGSVGEPTITDLREDDIPHTPEVTAGSKFTLGGILGRH